MENIITIKGVLRCLELSFILNIIFHQSKIRELWVEEYNMNRFSKMLNCKCMGVPYKYMVMVVGGNPRKKDL